MTIPHTYMLTTPIKWWIFFFFSFRFIFSCIWEITKFGNWVKWSGTGGICSGFTMMYMRTFTFPSPLILLWVLTSDNTTPRLHLLCIIWSFTLTWAVLTPYPNVCHLVLTTGSICYESRKLRQLNPIHLILLQTLGVPCWKNCTECKALMNAN